MKEIYYCNRCKSAFGHLESETHQSDGGEFWGSQSYITFTDCQCPLCGSEDYETIDTYDMESVIEDFLGELEIDSKDIQAMDNVQLKELKIKVENYLEEYIKENYNNSFYTNFKVDDKGNFKVCYLECDE